MGDGATEYGGMLVPYQVPGLSTLNAMMAISLWPNLSQKDDRLVTLAIYSTTLLAGAGPPGFVLPRTRHSFSGPCRAHESSGDVRRSPVRRW